MACKSAKRTDEYHGWECTITEGPCGFYIPDSKACAEKFGEGPDSHDEDNQKEIECKKCDYHTEDGECVMECAWCKYYEVDEEMEPCDSCLRTNLCNFIANDEETIKIAEERLQNDDGTRYTTEDILEMRKRNKGNGINISEVLSRENLGKKFICQENGCTVMNNGQTLIFLHSEFNNGDGVWRDAHVSHIWVGSKYTPIREE